MFAPEKDCWQSFTLLENWFTSQILFHVQTHISQRFHYDPPKLGHLHRNQRIAVTLHGDPIFSFWTINFPSLALARIHIAWCHFKMKLKSTVCQLMHVSLQLSWAQCLKLLLKKTRFWSNIWFWHHPKLIEEQLTLFNNNGTTILLEEIRLTTWDV